MSKQQNDTLELLKLFASYMVVFIHVIFSGKIGTAVETLARFAVPFFFLISGFYSYQIPPQKIKKRIKKILTLIIFATVSYTLFNMLLLLSNNKLEGVVAYFRQYTDLFTLIKLFVFNVPICSEYLWYLYAIFYVYAIYYFATIFHVKEKTIFTVSFSILILHVLAGELLSAFGILLPGLIVRNFATIGIPFFVLGLFAKKHQHKFLAIPNYVILLSIIIGILESFFSRYFFEKKEIYIGSLCILFAFMCVFMKYSTIRYPKFLIALEGCSTYIYIFHDMISKTIRALYTAVGIDMKSSIVLTNLHPIIVCISATVFAYMLIKIQYMLQKQQNSIRFHKEHIA